MTSLFEKISSVFHRKSDHQPFEKRLADIDQKIRKIEVRLTLYKLNERKLLASLFLYGGLSCILLALAIFLVYWPENYLSRFLLLLLLLVLPFILYIIRVAICYFYRKRAFSDQTLLDTLRAQQRLQVEDLKKRTSYYAMKELIDRYDTSVVNSSPRSQNNNLPTRRPETPSRDVVDSPSRNTRSNEKPKVSPNTSQKQQSEIAPIAPVVLPRRSWLDKIVDFLVGEGPAAKYALICIRCHQHNGLAISEDASNIGFICMYCQFTNPIKPKKDENEALANVRVDKAKQSEEDDTSVEKIANVKKDAEQPIRLKSPKSATNQSNAANIVDLSTKRK